MQEDGFLSLGEAAAQVVEGVRARLENQIPKSPGGCRSRAAGKSGGTIAMKGDLAGGNEENPGKLGRAKARIW
jgi:hypothetical protein